MYIAVKSAGSCSSNRRRPALSYSFAHDDAIFRNGSEYSQYVFRNCIKECAKAVKTSM